VVPDGALIQTRVRAAETKGGKVREVQNFRALAGLRSAAG
jgi:hypothetical protein